MNQKSRTFKENSLNKVDSMNIYIYFFCRCQRLIAHSTYKCLLHFFPITSPFIPVFTVPIRTLAINSAVYILCRILRHGFLNVGLHLAPCLALPIFQEVSLWHLVFAFTSTSIGIQVVSASPVWSSLNTRWGVCRELTAQPLHFINLKDRWGGELYTQ